MISKPARLQVFKRVQLRGKVFIHNDDELYQASIGNISAGGLFLNDVTELKLGSVVRVVIKAQGLDMPIQAVGRVVRIEADDIRTGLAVEFTSISRQSREDIQNCVHEARMRDALKTA
ncbi:MAG: PilZ domain-containing protein [Deltaproteobacteria bacterium]|nr:PilZ domain-containing protein [Deltaproteobacteria bacterium]MBI3294497.1 PilZ domain-containing protein [Deltaproteobacteria bacterium]